MLCHQHIAGAVFRADFIHRAGLFIQVVLARAFHLDNQVIALVAALQAGAQIALHRLNRNIIHIFHAGRHNAAHNQLINRADGCLRRVKNRQQIHAVLRQRQQLHRNLRNNTQRTLAANHQLLQAVACRLLLQTSAQLHDFACRIDNLNRIHLMTRRAIFHGTVAAGIRRHVAADKAGITAAGVACVKSALGSRCCLQVGGAHARLYDCIHSLSINLDYFIHLFQRKHHAAINRHSAAGQTGACTARHHRKMIFIRQLHHGCDLLRIFRKNSSLRQMMIGWVGNLIMSIQLHLLCLAQHILRADQGLQLRNYFLRNLVIFHFNCLPHKKDYM